MPRVDIPIQAAQVIPRDIIAIVGKLDALPAPRGAPVTFDGTTLDLLRDKLQALETVEGERIKLLGIFQR